ncbi:MAG: tetratricopeptide repeat protein [Candidatus Heimdallarchaeota archaeon]|nr:tetratricopeptide repeat protein [Candidatus Heimdallarchaeota archaeon]
MDFNSCLNLYLTGQYSAILDFKNDLTELKFKALVAYEIGKFSMGVKITSDNEIVDDELKFLNQVNQQNLGILENIQDLIEKTNFDVPSVNDNLESIFWYVQKVFFLLDHYVVNYDMIKFNQFFDSLEIFQEKLPFIKYYQPLWQARANIRNGDFNKAINLLEIATDIPKQNQYHQLQISLEHAIVVRKLAQFDRSIELFAYVITQSKELSSNIILSNAYQGLAILYQNQGEFQLAEENLLKGLEIRLEIGNKMKLVTSYYVLGINSEHQGEYKKALSNYQMSLAISEELQVKPYIASSLMSIGIIYQNLGDYVAAIDHYNKSLKIHQELNDEMEIANVTMFIGTIYQYRGKLIEAEEFFLSAKEIFDRKKHPYSQALILAYLGDTYQLRGLYEKAYNYHLKSLGLFKSINRKLKICYSLLALGILSIYTYEYDQALSYLRESMSLAEEIGNFKVISEIAFYQILTLCQTDNIEDANLIYSKVFQDEQHNEFVILKKQVIRALILSKSNRIKDRIKAQSAFEKIILQDTVIDHDLKVFSTLKTMELLLDEYRLDEDVEVLEEIEKYLNILLEISIKQSSSNLRIETLIIKSKLLLISGDLSETDRILEEAVKIAEKDQLEHQLVKISEIKDDLRTNLRKWENLLSRNASVKEKLQEVELKEFMKNASRVYCEMISQ